MHLPLTLLLLALADGPRTSAYRLPTLRAPGPRRTLEPSEPAERAMPCRNSRRK
jgi:hypothetical protein